MKITDNVFLDSSWFARGYRKHAKPLNHEDFFKMLSKVCFPVMLSRLDSACC